MAGNMLDGLIGFLMRVYRRSPLHSQEVGSLLAKCLAVVSPRRKQGMVVRDVDRIRFELDLAQVIDASLYYSGTFEPDEEQAISRMLKPGMIAIDIGANFGYHTFRMARLVQPGGRILAIEPTSWAYEKLLRNASLNPQLDNITFLKLGLEEADLGQVEIAFQSSYRIDGKSTDVSEQVRLARLDTLIKEKDLGRLDFIKLDVDGMEARVLRGAMETLARFHPHLLMEISPGIMRSNGDNPEALISDLVGLGYRFENTQGVPIVDLSLACQKIPRNSSLMVQAIAKD